MLIGVLASSCIDMQVAGVCSVRPHDRPTSVGIAEPRVVWGFSGVLSDVCVDSSSFKVPPGLVEVWFRSRDAAVFGASRDDCGSRPPYTQPVRRERAAHFRDGVQEVYATMPNARIVATPSLRPRSCALYALTPYQAERLPAVPRGAHDAARGS